MQFKRNQLEDAIAMLVEPKARSASAPLRTRIKRLFETDRALGRSPRSADPALSRYAFFSEEPPGRGAEVQFSAYEAFATLIALYLMQHGWTQNIAVWIMRQARDELEAQYARILELRRQKKVSELNLDNSPFLVIITSAGAEDTYQAFACSVRVGYRKAAEWTWEYGREHGYSMFELASRAQNIEVALAKTEPRRRGQPA